MKLDELLSALRGLQVETGSLACLGCGHEHNCGIYGCRIINEAFWRLARQRSGILAIDARRDTARGTERALLSAVLKVLESDDEEGGVDNGGFE